MAQPLPHNHVGALFLRDGHFLVVAQVDEPRVVEHLRDVADNVCAHLVGLILLILSKKLCTSASLRETKRDDGLANRHSKRAHSGNVELRSESLCGAIRRADLTACR